MKAALRYFVNIYAFWIIFFGLFRVFFLWYHRSKFTDFGLVDFLQVAWYGLYMDLSMAGYFSVLPFLFFCLKGKISARWFGRILKGYLLALAGFSIFLLCIDLEIFQNWGHRLDSAIVPYLKYPAEAFASSFSSPLFFLTLVMVVFNALVFWAWKKVLRPVSVGPYVSWMISLTGILATALLFIPIRGGFQLSPMNQSSVYFSTHRILNQAAENGIWVFIKSLMDGGGETLEKEYVRSDPKEVQKFIESLYGPGQPFERVLKVKKPNVIVIVWESLTAKVVGSFGGTYPSTPNLDRIAKDGIRFSNFYANGDRSDKGLAAILGSVPSLGKISIMAEPNSAPRISYLNPFMENLGYSSAFLYGGELEFANMKSFMLNAGFDRIISKSDFPAESYNSKWGAHDEVLFERQILEANKAKAPFFQTMFTLSSHEPFEVPGVKNTGLEPTDSLFCRSHRYTDRCLGAWLKKAKKQSWWKNTLVVLMADHGHRAPGNSGEADELKFKIPMVWFGPALEKNGLVVSSLGSQTDFSTTLLAQLGDSSQVIPFSRNLLSPSKNPFAFYSFRNGSVFKTEQTKESVFDQDPVFNSAQRYRQAVYAWFYGQPKP